MAKLKVDESMIHGDVAPGFEVVREEFVKNFQERGELGAACAAYHEGEKVVDLWGGYRDHRNLLPWEEDTLVLVFSTTKGVSGMTVAVAHSQGLFDYDEKVATYWPEFAQQGKEDVTVRQLLSHQAGLPVIDEKLTPEVLADLDAVGAAIAKQKPAWEPGTKHGYHGITLGFYENELLRRVDPQNRSIGQFLQDELAIPLDFEFYIGTPKEIPDSRIAVIKDFIPIQSLFHMGDMPRPFVLELIKPWSLSFRSLLNPRVRRPGDYHKPPWRYLEVPAANGIGQVRGIARAYSAFAMGGTELDLDDETLRSLTEPATPPSTCLFDEALRCDTSFSLGFMKPFPEFQFGSSGKSFGTPGAGGSFGFADPDAGIGFAYAMSRMGFHLFDDPREKALRDALYRCIK
jgi:CubicO group peptidase (beta-lactamase class C family)